MPVPADNPSTPAKIELGRHLFSEPALTRRHYCVRYLSRSRARFYRRQLVAHGIDHLDGTRRVPALINRGYGRSFFWDGRAATLEEQVLQPILNPREMGMTIDLTLAGCARTAYRARSSPCSDPDQRRRSGPCARVLCAQHPLGGFAVRPLSGRRKGRAYARAGGRRDSVQQQGQLLVLSQWPELQR